jgi:hypothetical protein
MKSISTAVGVLALTGAILAAVSPAFALGRCGPNGHRDHWGNCRWGGQNQAWCLRHTGHVAFRAADGSMWCPH